MGLNISFKISAIDDFSKTMSSLEKQTKKAFDSVGHVGAAMTAMGAVTAAGLGVAVRTTADFESAMSRVGALSGATESELGKLTDTAKQLGESTAFSASEAAQGMQFLAMAGYETNEIIDAMPGLLSAASAGQVDLARTADITSNILSGFGMQASETARVADVLTKAFTSSNVDLSMLGETMKYVAPVAKSTGQSLEEMAAATGILGNAGIQGSQAGTALRMSLIRLADPPKEAAETLAALGVSVSDANGEFLPLSDIIEQLSEKTKGMSEAQRVAAISTITGTEAASAFLTLMDAGADDLRKFTSELENAGGTAETVAGKQLDNTNGQLTLLKSALEGAMISVGTALLPAVKALVSGIQWLVNAFNSLPAPVKSFIAITAAVVAVLGLVIGPILLIIGFIPSLVAGFTAIAGAVGVTAGALLGIIGTIVAVASGVGLLIAAIVIAYKKIKWFRDFVDKVWKVIKTAFSKALNFVSKVVRSVMEALSNYFGEKLSEIQKFWDENGAEIMEIARKVYDFLKTHIQSRLESIGKVFKAVWGVIEGITKIVWEVIKTVIDSTLDVILGTVKVFTKIFNGDWKGALEASEEITDKVLGNITSLFKNLNIVDSVKTALSKVKEEFESWGDDISNWWGSFTSNVSNWGENMIDSIVEGFKRKKQAISDWFDSIPGLIKEKMTKWGEAILRWTEEQHNENIRQFSEWGKAIAEWFDSIPDTISDKLSRWWDVIVEWFDSKVEAITEKLSVWWAAISNWFTSIPSKISEKLSEWWTAISEWFTAAPENLYELLAGWWNQISTWFSEIPEKINAKLEEWWAAIKNWFKGVPEKPEIKNAGKNMIDKMSEGNEEKRQDFIDKLGQMIVDVVGAALAIAGVALIAAGREVIKRMIEGIQSAKSSLSQKMDEMKAKIVEKVESIDLTQIGKDIVGGLISGIASKFGDVKKKVGELASMVPSWAKKMLGIHSPSRVLEEEVGQWLPAGIAEGITGGLNVVKKATNAMAETAIPRIDTRQAAIETGMTAVEVESTTQQQSEPQPINVERMFEGAVINVQNGYDVKEMMREAAEFLQSSKRRKGVR